MDTKDAIFRLVDNDVSFLPVITSYEREKILDMIRQSPLKSKVLDSCFNTLKEQFPEFAFRIVFDMPEYESFCINFLDNNFNTLNDNRFFGYFFIGKNKWSVEYVKKNISRLKELDSGIISITLRYAMDVNNTELLNLLLWSSDLELRGIAMVELMECSPYRFMEWYHDLLSAFVIYDENGNVKELMNERYVSRIAYAIVDYELGVENYDLVKDFILNNYSKNSLAERLDGMNVDEEIGIEFGEHLDILFRDMDALFMTSSNYKFRLFAKYPHKISDDIRKEFYDAIREYIMIDSEAVEHMFKVGLGDKFIEYTKKYMELSTGAKVVGNAGIGSCTRSFIVGDYVVKCSYKKWLTSRCPDLYLVAKNYEEDIVKSHFGSVIGALEVQKYYSKPLDPKDDRLVGKFYKSLEDLGYTFDDNVLGLNQSPNIFYLDDYREADCEDPESLPRWFKKDPIVLVDRDYVHKVKKREYWFEPRK